MTDALPSLTHLMLDAARISAALTLIPVLGEKRGPRLAVVALSFWLAFVLASLQPQQLALDGLALALATGGEVLVGLVIGFGLRLVLLPLEISGEFFSHESGLALPASLDPNSGAPSTTFSVLLHSVAVLLFIALGGPELAVTLLGRSFDVLPAGAVGVGILSGGSLAVIPLLFARMFQAALELALPVVLASLTGTAVLAVLAKAIPQINLFSDAYPLRTCTVVCALLVCLPFTTRAVEWGLHDAALPALVGWLSSGRL